jgi:NAD(P)-dependent dehydrogenase (short-subunit alcohol dehydrogenase family)
MSFEKLNSLSGQVVVITGANGAIARATAKRLSSIGAKVIGIARTDTKEVRDFYSSIDGIIYFADVTDTQAINQIAKETPKCDILINNAGWTTIIEHQNLEAMTDDLIDKILNVNLKSQFTTTRAFLPLLKQSNNALVINISSGAAEGKGYGSNIMYAASKSAINGMTKDLARALAPKIRVIAIAPPLVTDSNFSGFSPDHKIKSGMRIPLRRGSNTEDVANAIEAYATTVRFTTGITVAVDGGRGLV